MRKFFQSVSWDILLSIIAKTIICPKTFKLIKTIVTTHNNLAKPPTTTLPQLSLFTPIEPSQNSISVENRTGLPIGNLTSQLFANIYLNQLDHFVKDRLRVRYYARYMDDFLIIHPDKEYLKNLRDKIGLFLKEELQLTLHPKKLTIKNVADGVPFVGYRIFYDHILIRGNTLHRIERNYRSKVKQVKRGTLPDKKLAETKASIIGHLKHADSFSLTKKMFGK